jgi:hypothetical protein
MIFDLIGQRRAGRRHRLEGFSPLPLRGWRLVVAGLLFLGMWLIGMWSMNSAPSGVPERRGDAYVMNNHGRLREIEREEWERARALELRSTAAIMLVFAGGAALVLTQPDAPDERPFAPRQPRADYAGRLGWWARLRGFRVVTLETALPRDEVVSRFSRLLPTLRLHTEPGDVLVGEAEWREKQRWPLSQWPLDLRVDVTLTPMPGGSTQVHARLGMGTLFASLMPLGGLWGLFGMKIVFDLWFGGDAFAVLPIALFLAASLGIGGYVTWTFVTTPSRATGRVEKQLREQLGG